jgi:hypothetical protein
LLLPFAITLITTRTSAHTTVDSESTIASTGRIRHAGFP